MSNINFDDFKEFINGKKAAVIGVGISNTPLIRWLVSLGCKVTACDKMTSDDPVLKKNIEALSDIAMKLVAHPPELAAISLCSPEVGGRRTRAAPKGAEILLLRLFIILWPRAVGAVTTPGLHSPSACREDQTVGMT